MSSSKDTSEKSEKQQIRDLEKELAVERHEHQMTKFTLRDVQEELERMSKKIESKEKATGIVDLENLVAENADLKSMLKRKDDGIEEQNERIRELEEQLKNQKSHSIAELRDDNKEMERIGKENQNLRIKNGELDELVKKLESEKTELKDALERQTKTFENAEVKWNWVKMERDNLAEQLKKRNEEMERMSQVLKENMEIIDNCKRSLESTKLLESEREELENQLKKQSDALADYRTRLEEHREEIDRLETANAKAIWACRYWIIKCSQITAILIPISKEKNLMENVKKLEEDWSEMNSEDGWWMNYHQLSSHLSMAFKGIQEVRSDSDSKEALSLIRGALRRRKEMFDTISKVVSDGKEGKEWVEMELASKYFETWERLVMEKEARNHEKP